jgi:hypothetical protein
LPVTDVKRVVWYLRKIALFADLGGETLARLAEKVEMREVRRREVMYLPGDPGTRCSRSSPGASSLSKVTRDGKSLTLAYVRHRRAVRRGLPHRRRPARAARWRRRREAPSSPRSSATTSSAARRLAELARWP